MSPQPFRHPLRVLGLLALTAPLSASFAQGGQVNGNFSTDAQYYNDDEQIGAVAPAARFANNAWANINYTQGPFRAGIRLENYSPALLGYPAGQGYKGAGLGYRYITFTKEDLEVTVGNFYEQFGQGLSFRSYEERYLGVDNAMDGVRLKFSPDTGIYLKAFVGSQRLAFVDGTVKGAGIVRGLDAEISLLEAFPGISPKWVEKGKNLTIGASLVSKYEADQDPLWNFPENVAIGAGRLNYTTPKWNVYGEYAYKINDPNVTNGYIYKPGQAALLNATYSTRGFGVSAGAHSYDNMAFQSSRGAPTLFDLNINFLPTLAKQHTYNLPATLYPYATQPNGEVAYQGEVFYKFKKGSLLGGKYGTKLAVNWSGAWGLDTTKVLNDTVHYLGYRSKFMQQGSHQYFSDFNVEVRKKMSETWEFALTYINLMYDINVIQGKSGHPVIYADMFILEGLHNFTDRNSVRFEVQHLSTKQDYGNWATALAEFTFSPHWFVAAMDQYNYGGQVETKKIHYPIGMFGYIRGGNRFSFSYGRQRAGIFCVGGVCRVVPAANGLTMSITSTF